MAWSFEQSDYKMVCEVHGPLDGPATIIIHENGADIFHEDVVKNTPEDAIEFQARLWKRIWELQERFRQRASAGCQSAGSSN